MATVTNLKHDAGKARRTLGVCGIAHFLHDGFTDAIYVLLPLWAQTFGLSLAQVGLLKAVTSGALASFQLPAGFLSERFGPKGILALGTMVAGSGYLLAGAVGGFAGLLLAVAVIGLGAGVQHPLSSALVAGVYRAGGRRAALGIYNFTGDLGKMVVPPAVALGAAWIGWRESSVAYGIVGIAGGIAIWLLLNRMAPRASIAAPPDETATTGTTTGRRGWGIRDRPGFFLLSAIGFFDTAVRYGFLPFLPFLLIEQKGAEVGIVGFALGLVFTGGAIGKFACGLLAERIGIIRSVVITEAITGLGILALPFLPLIPAMVLLPVIGIALNGTSSVLYGTVSDFVEEDRQARAFSLFYTVGVGAGAVSPAIFGLVGDAYGIPAALAIIAAMALAIILICPFLASRLAAAEAVGTD